MLLGALRSLAQRRACLSSAAAEHGVLHLTLSPPAPRRAPAAAAAAAGAPRRPTLDDVQRLSEGRAARTRGTGSRQIPHRLNAEERRAWDVARQRGYLTLRGSGYRRERKGSPLANIWRQLADVHGTPCVLVEQQQLQQGAPAPADGGDVVVVDLSPLRLVGARAAAAAAAAAAALAERAAGAAPLPRGAHVPPFLHIVPLELIDVLERSLSGGAAVGGGGGGGEEDSDLLERAREHVLGAPIWALPPRALCFRCADRAAAKELARALAEGGAGIAAAAAEAAAAEAAAEEAAAAGEALEAQTA